ncbi:MAG: hypothetical protein FWE42_06660 [Defluviitaleaceae bacterium]|nr:hypothetical protein [Defluviitaleaceae bacterium]
MIDFKEEINKYKPIRTMDEVEDAVRDEIMDIMDLLQYISNKPAKNDESESAPAKQVSDTNL